MKGVVCIKRYLPAALFIANFFIAPYGLFAQTRQITQTVAAGVPTTPVTFPGAGCLNSWVNNNPGIGLPASGTGNSIPSFIPINNTNAPITATITATPVPTGFAYIANTSDSSVTVINTITDTKVASIPTHTSPKGISVSADGSRVYVSNQINNSVSVIDAATRTIIATIPVLSPNGIVVSPDGSRLYVATSGGDYVSSINTTTFKVIKKIHLNSTVPQGIAINGDGTFVYTANLQSGTMGLIRTSDDTWVDNFPMPPSGFFGIAVNQAYNKIYIANENNFIAVVDGYTNRLIKKIAFPVSFAYGITASKDGKRVYAVGQQSSTVMVIDAVADTAITTVIVGTYPIAASVTPDGRKVYITISGTNNVAVIDAATNTVTGYIESGETPNSFGNFIFEPTDCVPSTITYTIYPKASINPSGNLATLTKVYGTVSPSTSFKVSGTNVSGNILITAPAAFEVSTDNANFGSTATITGIGNLTDIPVYIRLIASNVVGTYSGNIILTSGTATATMPTQTNNTVTPAPLTVTVVNKAKLYLIANPQLTVTYSGFVNGDGPSALTTQPSITTTATVTSPAGQYPITATGAVAANYSITYVPGVLNVYPVIIIPSAFTPNGDGINDRWEITYLNAFEGAVLQVYNRYGQLVYKSIGYNTPWDGTANGKAIPFGTYYYIITVGEGSNPMSGYLQIIR